jgi:serine/threonine-protein kinase
LVAIAVGGSCSFTVDGQGQGTTSSIRLKVPVGVHTVSCARTGQATRSRTIKVKSNQPGMVMFRLN